MRLLIEKVDNADLIIEKTQGEKEYFIQGPFLQAEVCNHNGRVYPRAVIEKEVSRYVKEKIETNMAVGELDHPKEPTINMDRISHKIISLVQEGDIWIGKARISKTPMGNIVKALIDDGICFGVSSRGLGSLRDEHGTRYVCDDYMLITPGDIVSEPAGPQCFVDAIMENREWAWENGRLIEKEREVKELINTMSKKGINEDRLLDVFKYILRQI